MKFDDLDAATKRAIRNGRTVTPASPPRRAKPAVVPRDVTDLSWWRCRACGRTSTTWATIERHVNTVHGGGRIAWEYRTEAG